MPVSPNSLIEGKYYEVTYRQQSGNYRWYEWTMTAQYLGQSHPFGEKIETHWNLRPKAGTTWLALDHIISATAIEAVPKLPKRKVGAVDAP